MDGCHEREQVPPEIMEDGPTVMYGFPKPHRDEFPGWLDIGTKQMVPQDERAEVLVGEANVRTVVRAMACRGKDEPPTDPTPRPWEIRVLNRLVKTVELHHYEYEAWINREG